VPFTGNQPVLLEYGKQILDQCHLFEIEFNVFWQFAPWLLVPLANLYDWYKMTRYGLFGLLVPDNVVSINEME
jgi:hypothetical protein